jgi:hypothetical protein
MTETSTTMANGVQRLSDNPWHNMKGLRGKMRVQGTILPKRLLRPYFYTYPERIDDKQYLAGSITRSGGRDLGTQYITITRSGDTIHNYYCRGEYRSG